MVELLSEQILELTPALVLSARLATCGVDDRLAVAAALRRIVHLTAGRVVAGRFIGPIRVRIGRRVFGFAVVGQNHRRTDGREEFAVRSAIIK